MGFLAEIAEHEEDESTKEPETDFFVPFALGKLFEAKGFADLLVQMKLLVDQDFVKLINTAVEMDARFYALSQTDRDEVLRQILAGMDCATVIEAVDPAPLSAKAIRRIKSFEDLCDTRLAEQAARVPPISETLH